MRTRTPIGVLPQASRIAEQLMTVTAAVVSSCKGEKEVEGATRSQTK